MFAALFFGGALLFLAMLFVASALIGSVTQIKVRSTSRIYSGDSGDIGLADSGLLPTKPNDFSNL